MLRACITNMVFYFIFHQLKITITVNYICLLYYLIYVMEFNSIMLYYHTEGFLNLTSNLIWSMLIDESSGLNMLIHFKPTKSLCQYLAVQANGLLYTAYHIFIIPIKHFACMRIATILRTCGYFFKL